MAAVFLVAAAVAAAFVVGVRQSEAQTPGAPRADFSVASPSNLRNILVCGKNANVPYHQYNQLTWGAVAGATGYKVYSEQYLETPDKVKDPWKLIATVTDAASTKAPVGKQPSGAGPFTTFYDNGLGHGGPFPAIGANYSYKVTAVVGGQESPVSNVVSQEGGADACPAGEKPPPPLPTFTPPPITGPKPKVELYISATGNCNAKAKEAEIVKGTKATLCWKATAAE